VRPAWLIIRGSLAFLSSLYILAVGNRGWDPAPGEVVAGINVVLLFAYIWKSARNHNRSVHPW